MRACCLLCLVCCLPLLLDAQLVRVLGVQDGDTTTLSDASVLIKPLGQDTRTSAQLTSAEGTAQFAFAGQTCLVQVQMLGFSPFTDTLKLNEELTIKLQANGLATDPLVVTGQMDGIRADQAIHNIRVIDRQRIDAMAAVTARDLLTQELNIRISQDNILGSVMNMQGLGGENVKVLVDGVPVVGRQGGNIDLGQLNLNDIERVEIIEGPMAVNYGADALGGVINLITKKNQQDPIDVGVSAYTENIGHANVDGYLGVRKGKHSLRLSGGRNFFGGWSPDNYEAERGDQWNPREQVFASLMYGLHLKKGRLLYRGNGFDETISNFGAPIRNPFSIYAFDDYYRTRRLDNELQAAFRLGNWQLDGVASYKIFHRLKNTYRKDLNTLEQNLTPDPTDQDTTRFDLFLSRGTAAWLPAGKPFKLQLGYETSFETSQGDRIDAGNQTQGDYAGFGNFEYTPTRGLDMRVGVRWGYNTAYDMPIAPAFHIKYKFHPDWVVRASYARGFRAPSLREQYLFFVDINHNIRGNSDLLAETSHSFNGSLQYLKLLKNAVFQLGLHGFYNNVDNLITLAMVDPETLLFTYTNVGNRQTFGSRLEATIRHERLHVQLGGTYNGFSNQLTVSSAPQVSFSPEARATVQYRIPVLETQVSVFYKYNGRVPQFIQTDENTLQEGFIEDFHTVDLTLSRSVWQNRLRLDLGVRNLADVQNINAMATGGAHSGGGNMAVATGRSYFAKLSFNY